MRRGYICPASLALQHRAGLSPTQPHCIHLHVLRVFGCSDLGHGGHRSMLVGVFQAQHQELLSQQQDIILVTQAAQAFLDKHGHSLPGEERARLQGGLAELKERYAASLARSEVQLKQVQVLRDELQKFLRDHGEFEAWLKQAEQDLEGMCKGDSDPASLRQLLLRQGSFSEDVISHKGDLRFITMSGQKVLDAEGAAGDAGSSGSVVKSKLEDASQRYTTLHSKVCRGLCKLWDSWALSACCHLVCILPLCLFAPLQCTKLGSHLSTLLDHYQQFQEVAESLRTWLEDSEAAVGKLLSESVSSDPTALQEQLASAGVRGAQVIFWGSAGAHTEPLLCSLSAGHQQRGRDSGCSCFAGWVQCYTCRLSSHCWAVLGGVEHEDEGLQGMLLWDVGRKFAHCECPQAA